jgi:hypothetical protein
MDEKRGKWNFLAIFLTNVLLFVIFGRYLFFIHLRLTGSGGQNSAEEKTNK